MTERLAPPRGQPLTGAVHGHHHAAVSQKRAHPLFRVEPLRRGQDGLPRELGHLGFHVT